MTTHTHRYGTTHTVEAFNSQLQPCGHCGRTFTSDTLTRHQEVCEKNSQKRKVFDSSKQRAPEGAKQAQVYMQRSKNKMQPPRLTKKPTQNEGHKNENEMQPKPKSNSREKQEDLLKTIKRAREDVEDSQAEEEEPKKKVPAGYIQCPGCNRCFNQRAAERHILWCQQKKGNTPKSSTEKVESKGKLNARVKYRPPQGKSSVCHWK